MSYAGRLVCLDRAVSSCTKSFRAPCGGDRTLRVSGREVTLPLRRGFGGENAPSESREEAYDGIVLRTGASE